MPNYQEPTFGEDGETYASHCWVPGCETTDAKGKKIKTEINSDECEKCTECNYAYKCNVCGECECARPNSKIRANMEKWANRKNSL